MVVCCSFCWARSPRAGLAAGTQPGTGLLFPLAERSPALGTPTQTGLRTTRPGRISPGRWRHGIRAAPAGPIQSMAGEAVPARADAGSHRR
jgi:hypothetical protein